MIDGSARGAGALLPSLETIDTNGFAVVRGVASRADLEHLIPLLPTVPRGGVRNLLSACSEARELSGSGRVRALAEGILGPGAFVVRAILFDKTPGANWSVPYHQDGTIAVREQLEVTGFGPWSVKDGVTHVQPPAPILERMVTVRLHIDPCDETNGPLTVLPGSHAHGFLSDLEIARWKAEGRPFVCTCEAGDAILMRPLILHASPKAASPAHRRVIHLEYAIDPLPNGLEWATP